MNTCVISVIREENGKIQCRETDLWIDDSICSKCQWNVDYSGDKIVCAFPIFEGE